MTDHTGKSSPKLLYVDWAGMRLNMFQDRSVPLESALEDLLQIAKEVKKKGGIKGFMRSVRAWRAGQVQLARQAGWTEEEIGWIFNLPKKEKEKHG